jgi:hypothetical protein
MAGGGRAPYRRSMTTTDTAQRKVAAGRTLGILSLIGGIASLALGHTIIVPVAAVVLGFVSRAKEPGARTFANWGIVLGLVSLFGWIALLLVFASFALPFVLTGAVR